MRKRIILATLLGPALAFSQVGVASADDAAVTANITAGGIGLRSIASLPIVMTATPGSDTVAGIMTTVVTEAAVTGVTPWYVTADLSSLTQGANTLTNSNVDISNRATIKVAGGGTVTNPGTTENMSAQRTVSTTTGQSALAVYTGTYTSTADLDLHIPNGTATGVYTGTMTLTLWQ